jgi:putative flippase GtrA
LSGAVIVNYTLNRNWTFQATASHSDNLTSSRYWKVKR